MVSRRMRNYKDKKPMTTFGQFVLPLAIIMALALLFFSIKLFFFNPVHKSSSVGGTSYSSSSQSQPSDQQQNDLHQEPAEPAAPIEDDTINAGPVSEPDTTSKPKPAVVKPAAPKPVVAAKPAPVPKPAAPPKPAPAPKPAAVKKTEPAKPAVKPAEPSKPQKPAEPVKPAEKPLPTAPSKGSVRRWDVQIGGFSTKDNAIQLLKKVREDGNEVYISEAVHNSAPIFRVRVKSGTKEEAQQLAKKLEAQGYPIYLIPIS